MLLDGPDLDFFLFFGPILPLALDFEGTALAKVIQGECSLLFVVGEDSLASWLTFFSIVFLTIMLRHMSVLVTLTCLLLLNLVLLLDVEDLGLQQGGVVDQLLIVP